MSDLTTEEFCRLIRMSGMVDDGRLNEYLSHRPGAQIGESRNLAEEMVRDGLITSFQAEQFLEGKWRGFTIGKYKILERVGVGGMGQVFLCEHLFMRKRVAIKVLPPAKAEQPAALGRFYREARAAGSLEHPHIVRTHDIDQDGNLHFIVMEYVDGSNLLDVVKRFGPLDIGRACSYARQASLGLDFAFRNGIIHRDIKPGNILIDRSGTAKILDMGLARFYLDQTDQLTVKYDDKIVLGTADYVAPEQVANSHTVDVRADVYALGATLYYLLAGHPPFPTGTVSQKLLWHRTKDPVAIRQVRPEVPEGLAAVVMRMLAKDPNVRYQSPAEVTLALQPWVPETVPLPREEEMPQLSKAAREGMFGLPDGSVAGSQSEVNVPSSIGTLPPTASRVVLQPLTRPIRQVPGPFAPKADPFGDHATAGPFTSSHPEAVTNSAVDDQATPAESRRSRQKKSVLQLVELYSSMSRNSTRRFYLLVIATVVCFLAAFGLILLAVSR